MSNHPKWNFAEFSAFLMYYAASADLEVTEEERVLILKKVDEATFKKIEDEYRSLSDAGIIDVILSYKGLYFPTVERKNELLDLMQKEFLADGDFSIMEQNMVRLIKKLM